MRPELLVLALNLDYSFKYGKLRYLPDSCHIRVTDICDTSIYH